MKAIVNGKVYTMAGAVLDQGTILIKDGKITAVGENIDIPSDAEIIDAKGKIVTPGFIDAHTHLGIGEEGIRWEGADYNEISNPVTPHLRAIDAINPEDEGFKDAVKGGITTVMTGPGSANVIGGENLVMKTYGRTVDEMVLRNPAGLKGAFGENPKRVYGTRMVPQSPVTRMATAALMRKALVDAQNYLNKLEQAEKEGKKPERDLEKENLVRLLKKEIPLRAHAHRADDILTILRIAKEFDIEVTLEHCTEGHKIADIIAEAGVPAIVGPSLTSRAKYELKDRTFETPGILAKAGVKVALMTDHPVIPVHYLPICAGLAVRHGMPEMEALKAITINAAEILGVADRVGSIEVGKDADIVIFDGHPLETMTKVVKVFINGEEVYSG
ncbi:amidohydrolase [Anoxybacter fermentans]|uniref:Amidohydrolase n=1 Tax=Anoxybacter fermentans TaxID=1323375 RepID=A0A3Q9HNC1_9FIRM|nr:amidohydrolase [Anoxybacter fermentans]AZR71985.1 amidohydrolase [Anoxybacter fermentans]